MPEVRKLLAYGDSVVGCVDAQCYAGGFPLFCNCLCCCVKLIAGRIPAWVPPTRRIGSSALFLPVWMFADIASWAKLVIEIRLLAASLEHVLSSLLILRMGCTSALPRFFWPAIHLHYDDLFCNACELQYDAVGLRCAMQYDDLP
ncbi:hypothetical protein Nepgr_005334 [Nepenthes gracilis]|uniref:Uncharacterized protein n=1 Tax=Nepenthes gracilis TaxID=150966 RepID=A0AAD3XGA3_NEPGR|nr:hypothetical protein Nepgr_005334 [Nepenthes gracilis]